MLDDGEDRPGLTWLATAAGLLPTLVVQEFSRILLLPKLDVCWQQAHMQVSNAETVYQMTHHLLGHAASVLPTLLVLIVLLELFVKPSRRIRSLCAAMVAVGYNTSVLLGVVATAVVFALTSPQVGKGESSSAPAVQSEAATVSPSR